MMRPPAFVVALFLTSAAASPAMSGKECSARAGDTDFWSTVAAEDQGDAVALIQQNAFLGTGDARSAEIEVGTREVDCEKYPMFCHPSLDCGTFDPQTENFGERVATVDHRSNLRSWCSGYPMYANLVQECLINGDLHSSIQSTFEEQKERGADEADGSYCFLAGHCQNTKVTANTTAEQAEALCDEEYGRERWASLGENEVLLSWSQHLDLKRGFQERDSAVLGAILACAMGSYHCDVAYCQQAYCNTPHYRERYAHLSP